LAQAYSRCPIVRGCNQYYKYINAADPEYPLNSESEAKIENGPGPRVYVITGVVIAIIALGILTALVAAVVLFTKARYS
jgi:hypothetical protein